MTSEECLVIMHCKLEANVFEGCLISDVIPLNTAVITDFGCSGVVMQEGKWLQTVRIL